MKAFVEWLLFFWGLPKEALSSLKAEKLEGVDWPEGMTWGRLEKRLKRKVRDLGLVRAYLDEYGYTGVAVRALIQHHSADLTAEEKTDIVSALVILSDQERIQLALLAGGFTVIEIGRLYNCNGSRTLTNICTKIASKLEGTYKG